MKRTILFVVLMNGFFAPIFSQVNAHLKIDTTFRVFPIYNYQNSFKPAILGDFRSQLNSTSSANKCLFNRLSGRNRNFDQSSVETNEKAQSFDNMPCIKPKGSFPSRICEPDSTVKYSIRIEKMR